MEKDIDRLSVITERFSKIGSFPKLNRQDINIITQKLVFTYINIVNFNCEKDISNTFHFVF